MCVIRNELEIECNGGDSLITGDRDQRLAADCGATCQPNCRLSANGCGAGCGASLSSGSVDESVGKTADEEAPVLEGRRDRSVEATTTDILSLLEDVVSLSSNETATCPDLLTGHPVVDVTSGSAPVVKAEGSPTTTSLDTALKDATEVKMGRVRSDATGLSHCPGASCSDSTGPVHSLDISQFVSAPAVNSLPQPSSSGVARSGFSEATRIGVESRRSAASALLASADDRAAWTKLPAAEDSIGQLASSNLHPHGTGDCTENTAVENVPPGTSTRSELDRLSMRSSGPSAVVGRRNVSGQLSAACQSSCNNDNPDEAADDVNKTAGKDCGRESGKDSCWSFTAPRTLSAATSSCDVDIRGQSSNNGRLVLAGESAREANDGCRSGQYVGSADVTGTLDRDRDEDVESPISADDVGKSRGPTPRSLGCYGGGGCGSRMKGLRIPSTTASSTGDGGPSSAATAASHGIRTRLELPLIARRIRDPSSPGVLPATLLPRPFMPRSDYRSVRPFVATKSHHPEQTEARRLATVSAAGRTEMNSAGHDSNSTTAGPQVSGSTAAEDVETKPHQASCSHRPANSGVTGQFHVAVPVVREPLGPRDDHHLTCASGRDQVTSTNGVGESTAVTDDGKNTPASLQASPRCQLMANKLVNRTEFQYVHVLPNNLGTSDWTTSNTECPKTVISSDSAAHCRRKSNDSDVGEVTESASKDARDLSGFGISSQSTGKLSSPPTAMPKPSSPRRVDPLPSPSASSASSFQRSATQTDFVVSTPAEPQSRTITDGGLETGLHRVTSALTNTTSTKHLPGLATESAFSSAPGDQPSVLHEVEVVRSSKIIDNEVRAGRQESGEANDSITHPAAPGVDVVDSTAFKNLGSGTTNCSAVDPLSARSVAEKAGANGSRFGMSAVNKGCRHTSAEQTRLPSSCVKEPTEDQRTQRQGLSQENGNGKPELPPRIGGKRSDEATTFVDGRLRQLETEVISLEKGVFGLGFCIEGGRDCPAGRAPVTVKRIFRGELIRK